MSARISALLLCLFVPLCGRSSSETDKFARVDEAVAAAIENGDCPGAVVVVVHDDEVVYRKAYGDRAVKPDAEPMTADTVFDLASLTKPVATATSVMVLIERGKLRPEDPVAKHWPAFAANGKGEVTVAQLLLHTSGLTADNALADYTDGRDKALERIANLKLQAPAGMRFRYSDVGFIVLGVLVERISGKPLDRFASETVFDPLQMSATGYTPPDERVKRIAPTGTRDGKIIRGVVHDPRAFHMNGVAGHAGLFAPADDLARYCRMLLNGGELDGVRVLKPETVKMFTEPHRLPGDREQSRSYGWDVDTGYTSQRGERFPKGQGFGHTGFTGTSIWVDPGSGTAVILLTSRLHPDDKGNVLPLRRSVGTAVGEVLLEGSR